MIVKKIKSLFIALLKYIKRHKIKSFIALIIILTAGYYGNAFFSKSEEETRYILSSATKGVITTTVSGTGQISAKDTKTIKAEASGKLIYLNASEGQYVSKGTLLAKIDNSNSLDAVKDAEEELESAQISLDKLIGPDESNPKAKKDAKKDLSKAYEDGYNTVSSVFLDLPDIMKDLEEILYGRTFNNYQDNIEYYSSAAYGFNEKILEYRNVAEDSYKLARSSYNINFENYKKTNRYSDQAVVDAIITQTYENSKDIAQTIKDNINLIQFYKDALTYYDAEINSTAESHISSLSSHLSSINSCISSLFSANSSIEDKIEALEDVDTEIKDAKLTVTKKQRALEDAKDALADYYVYAPIGGLISEVIAEKGENISSGSSVVTIITESKIAEITLSEVDVANIETGNKATLTFDALEDLTLTGKVTGVDLVGSANSGVISYGIEITLDTIEDNIRAGMSVSTNIITNSKTNVLIVPTTAVKSNDDGTYYVQVLSDTYDLTDKTNSIKGVTSDSLPATKIVGIGLSDDTNTEITSGLAEGDQIIVRTSSSASASTSSSASSNRSGSSNIINVGGSRPPGM